MAWWLQNEHDGERGKQLTYDSDWIGDTEERMKAAESKVAAEMTAKYFTPDPGPRPWPASPYDPILGTGPGLGFRQPMPGSPYKLRFTEKVGYIADCLGWIITNRIRDVIEALEPGIHQYMPCEIYLKDETRVPDERWYLNICNRLETISPEHSNVIVDPADGYYLTGNGKADVKVWKHKVADHAIWSEWKYNNRTYVSDGFAEAIKALGVHGWVFRQYLPEV